ncbi:MAG: replicative helicase loader/inhibitor [Bacillota bacterium]
MTKLEVGRLIAAAAANWPQLQERDLAPTAALWERMLADIPYELAERALAKVLATARFFPTVAEIRSAALELTQGRRKTAAEAWDEVTQAMRRYGYYSEAEALASMTPEVAAMCQRFGWRDMCSCEDVEVLRGQFRKAWEAQQDAEREMAVLPAPIREMIQVASERVPSLGAGNKATHVGHAHDERRRLADPGRADVACAKGSFKSLGGWIDTGRDVADAEGEEG